ncbi:MAG: chromosome partitioning protein [Treponema sp.]|nr:chromosome partitioning protein [Treponema sp.]
MPRETAKPQDPLIGGGTVQDAKDTLVRYITSLKLTEKRYAQLGEEEARWTSRVDLARSRGALELAGEAEQEVERLRAARREVEADMAALRAQIEALRQQLPGLAARERTIDPDLLEQELLIATGRLPGCAQEAEAERALQHIEEEHAADAALKALKAKMTLG